MIINLMTAQTAISISIDHADTMQNEKFCTLDSDVTFDSFIGHSGFLGWCALSCT